MRDLGLPYELSANDICQPDPQEMMILVLYLFQVGHTEGCQRPSRQIWAGIWLCCFFVI